MNTKKPEPQEDREADTDSEGSVTYYFEGPGDKTVRPRPANMPVPSWWLEKRATPGQESQPA
jgi:hypothetical protein